MKNILNYPSMAGIDLSHFDQYMYGNNPMPNAQQSHV